MAATITPPLTPSTHERPPVPPAKLQLTSATTPANPRSEQAPTTTAISTGGGGGRINHCVSSHKDHAVASLRKSESLTRRNSTSAVTDLVPSRVHTTGKTDSVDQHRDEKTTERLSVCLNSGESGSRSSGRPGGCSRHHPLVTASKSVGVCPNEPQGAKQGQDNGPKLPPPPPPTHPHRGATPPLVAPETLSKQNLESPTASEENQGGSKGVAGNGSGGCGQVAVAEEARKRRQEQQRAQKEKWQKMYSIGVKRSSESDVNSGGENECGATAFNDECDDLISVGR